ncbi:MAG: nucleoside triphosphate pyrophosphohydrolase [Anaerolineales bacterium]|nr:nucleoside triphosphate pyrophosphohydrolase [Anaerolineales bacterium]
MAEQIIIVGLGPGGAGMLTREADEALSAAHEVWVRTARHPVVDELPGLAWKPMDSFYEREDDFSAVYEAIAAEILRLAERPEGVCYAVPGSPRVGEATVARILLEAEKRGLTARIVEGLSFIEPALGALGVDGLEGLHVSDAVDLAARHHPPFPPSAHALVAQLYSRALAGEAKLTLMNQYPDEHPVRLIHAAGTSGQLVEDLALHEIDRSERIAHLTTLYVPPIAGALEEFQETISHLRAPEGCPWDREQTHLTIRGNLMEEAYEVLAALDREDPRELAEELGDLLLQILLHAQIATEAGDFRMADVIAGIDEKIHRRHPHVFGGTKVEGVGQVLSNWEQIKAEERSGMETGGKAKGLFDGVPLALPALEQAVSYQKRAARVGFDWPTIAGVKAKVVEELAELEAAGGEQEREHELGDVFFALVNLARWLKVDSESALRKSNARFRARFGRVEAAAARTGKALKEMTLEELDALWEEAKKAENGE